MIIAVTLTVATATLLLSMMFNVRGLKFFSEGVVLLVSALVAVLGRHPHPDQAEHGAAEDDPDQAPQNGVLGEQRLLETECITLFRILTSLTSSASWT